MRKPFQGVWNIIRFNWPYFVLSTLSLVALLLVRHKFPDASPPVVISVIWLITLLNLIALLVSYFIYDLSSLYKLNWLDELPIGSAIINIHAGFDETSHLLAHKFPDAQLTVFDFYDPAKHTELSIKRARKAYPPFPNTQQISATKIPLPSDSINHIFTILSAHEIRNDEERISFFNELNRVLKSTGQVILTEHLRDQQIL